MGAKGFWEWMDGAPVSEARCEWNRRLGTNFDRVATVVLRRTEGDATWTPCPKQCCGGHRLVPVRYGGSGFIGICDDDEPSCMDLTLTAEEVVRWEMDYRRLRRAVARALHCEGREEEMGLPRTWMIGTFGGTNLPVVLTLPEGTAAFQRVVMELTMRLREQFILLAPTSRCMDTTCHAMLKMAKAGFFDLGSLLTLEADGSLRALGTAGELFTPYLPGDVRQRNEDEPPAARNLFRKAGSVWRVVFDGCPEFHIEDTLGAKYLDYLLHQPNQPILPFDLEVAATPEKGKARDKDSIQKGIDGDAVREYLRELEGLRAERDEAAEDGNQVETERLDHDIEAIGKELKRRGQSVDTGERARGNVSKAIIAVRNKLMKRSRHEKEFAEHIAERVSLGYKCNYNSPEGAIWK